ncbi:DNA methylase family protein [Treponema socranskii subsp. socranskii VPI DR56BR1116 = ATCC 35536]|uniref:Methyltransferase n=2 Tax=Treponema socranskii TaxID=53419 RepID=U1FPL8_TRESO|nr:site-specific DNA-methyltransferase [Treponema socranskii]ERF61833.1 DNA methylase family protein [Treponema socranskii subsp. socranskii VPI DR56BR1116 = ATCC 35536]ERK00440.1 DNA methylase family protein [Treponema socranskii subsp. socranskii VPI DR56BR1116 = ATCC 35536]
MEITENINLLHGDCIDLLPKIPAESIDAVITDPPYFLGMTHNGQKGCFNDLAICKPFYEKLFTAYKRVLKPDGCVYFFCDWRSYAFYYPIMYGILGVKNMLVWDKQAGPGNFYTYQHELVIFTTKRNAFNVKGTYSIISGIRSFVSGARKTNGEKVHPTQKPVELIEKFIKDSTDEGGTVLDTFMGSGTTGVACINTGRKFIGMELDDNYFSIAKTRIENAIREKERSLFSEQGAAANA